MTIRFARAARYQGPSALPLMRVRAPMSAANDNPPRFADPAVYHATLRHFAAHGLAAPRKAAQFARQAAARGDSARCQHWITICKALNHRLGRIVERQLSVGNTHPQN